MNWHLKLLSASFFSDKGIFNRNMVFILCPTQKHSILSRICHKTHFKKKIGSLRLDPEERMTKIVRSVEAMFYDP